MLHVLELSFWWIEMNPISRIVCSQGQHFSRTGQSASPLLSAVRGYGGAQFQAEKGARVIDMRSDVLTKPSAAVSEAMSQATADDDVYREDRTVLGNTVILKYFHAFVRILV